MKVSWTQGLDAQGIKDVTGDFLSSRILRHRLVSLLTKKIDEAETSSLNKDGYDIANWAYKQADLIGYKRAMKEIISLIQD